MFHIHKNALTGAKIGGERVSLYKRFAMIYEHNYRNTYEEGFTGQVPGMV